MGWLAAFLLGVLFGPRVRRVVERDIDHWTGESPPRYDGPPKHPPPSHEEHPPAPPEGWKEHPTPLPDDVKRRGDELYGPLWALGSGAKGGPEVKDWKHDGHPYAVLFRADEYQGKRGIGAYVDAAEHEQPPTPAKQPPKNIKPMPGGWKPHPNPMPKSIPQRAWALLPTLWNEGEGSYRIQSDIWGDPRSYPYEVLFRAEDHGNGKHGVTAYVRTDWTPAKLTPQPE